MSASGASSVKEKRRVEIRDFLGMDFTSSPTSVSPQRAVSGSNWEPVNGVNRKRRGVEQIYDMLGGRINGIFPYVRRDGTKELIVYAGTLFYSIHRETGEVREIPMKNTVGILPSGCVDRRCQGFYSEGYLYFVGCGIFLRYGLFDGAYEIRTVDPYIPVTTVGIGCTESADSAREAKELVNLLTPVRKNTLYGHGSAARWRLDAPIATKTDVTVAVEIPKGTGTVYEVYRNDGENADSLYNADGSVVGAVFFSEGAISLLGNTAPVGNVPNITVTFTAGTGGFGGARHGGMTWIYGCRFGCLFGVGGAEDRLFLSGNPDTPNTVYFSERRDFTYFPDQFTAVLGTDALAVTGFLPLADSALAVFKEEDERESSVYYVKGEYRSFYGEDGSLKRTVPVFSLSASGAGESLVSPYAVGMLGGDALILSGKGVFAIELSEGFSTDVRLTRSRSYTVKERLAGEELSEAVAATDGDRFYLSVGGHCYLADKKYTYRNRTTGQIEYDWWYWENFNARVFAHVDGELWFGSEDGGIFRFSSQCKDTSFLTGAAGDVGLDYSQGGFSLNRILFLRAYQGQRIRLLTEGVMGRILRGCLRIEGRKIFVDEKSFPLLSEGLGVYVASLGSSALKEGQLYYVCDVDRAALSFSLAAAKGGSAVSLTGLDTSFSVYVELSGRDLYIGRKSLSNEVIFVRLHPEGQDVMTENYFRPSEAGGEVRIIPVDPICRFFTERSIKASWETPPMDLGEALSFKDLFSVTIAARVCEGDALTVGYRTEERSDETFLDLCEAFSFLQTDLTAISFSGDTQEALCIPMREKSFERIRFFFSSDTASPTEVYSVGGIYKINKPKKGAM